MATILIVDDCVENRDLLAYLLGRRGHEIVLAAGGEEAVAVAASERPDLILMDLVMPGMNGQEAARTIRAQEALAATRILAYSAAYGTPLSYSGPDDELFEGFVRLPIEPGPLVAEIEAHLPSASPDSAPG